MSSASFPRGDSGGSAGATALEPRLLSLAAGVDPAKPRSVVGGCRSFCTSARPTIPINPAWISPPCVLPPPHPAFPATGLLTMGQWAPRLRSSAVVAGGVAVSRLRPWFIAMSLLVDVVYPDLVPDMDPVGRCSSSAMVSLAEGTREGSLQRGSAIGVGLCGDHSGLW